MQSLQTMSKAPTQSANLPPLQNLPSWTRNSLLRKKQPRQIIRDHLEPINPIVEEMDNSRALTKSNDKSSYTGRIVSALLQGQGLDQEQRIEHVEKTIDYLRTQHAETLSNLHREIERLKAENKDLNFKLIMARSGVNLASVNKGISPTLEETMLQSTGSEASSLIANQNEADSREEDKLPQPALKESRNTNIVQQTRSAKKNKRTGTGKKMVNGRAPSTPPLSAKSANLQPKSSGRTKTKLQNSLEKRPNLSSPYVFDLNTTPSPPTKQGVPTGKSLLVVTIKDKTVKVNMPTDSTPRSPTLVECKAIIKHQQETNKRQEQELSKLKSDLNDALYSDKWTPDAYLLAKSYVAEEIPPQTRHNTPATRSLPWLHSRDQTHSGRVIPGRMQVVHDNVSLPVLRPHGASNVAIRKRRQQALVRGRGKKDIF